jgi:hypothetical protein
VQTERLGRRLSLRLKIKMIRDFDGGSGWQMTWPKVNDQFQWFLVLY